MQFVRDAMSFLFGLRNGSFRSFTWRCRMRRLAGEPMLLSEIDELERDLGLPLPNSYKAYLAIAGNGNSARRYIGCDCHGDHLRNLRSRALTIMQESGVCAKLPDNAVFICEHQGYLCFFFIADGTSDDPNVYSYCEGESEVKLTGQRLTEWLTQW